MGDFRIGYLSSAIEAGRLSPVDVVHQAYEAIENYHKHDPAVWVHLVPKDAALARAQELLETYPNSNTRPALFGIPFSVKDSIDIAGIPTTLACSSFAYTAEATAFVVKRLLLAGAILIGKTNLDQFATGLTGTRSPYGAPRCVSDADYISGGSSSGSAVSVAASLVSFTICTDTGGSTRVPAALNGLVGLKPTLGLVSATGLFPACRNIDCVCVMAKTADDVEVVWDVIQAFDATDPFARRIIPTWKPWPRPVRFGFPSCDVLKSLSPVYGQLFAETIGALQRTGELLKVDFDYEPFEKANQMLYDSSIVSQRLLAFREYVRVHGYNQLHPAIKATFEAAEAQSFDAIKAYEDIFALAQYKRDAENEFDKIDILIVPTTVCHWTMAELAEDHMGKNKVMGKFTNFVNLLDLCAISIPVRSWRSINGKVMSFGVTIIGQAGTDKELLDISRKIMHLPVHAE